MGIPMSDRKPTFQELRIATKSLPGHTEALVARPAGWEKMGYRGLTFNQEHLKVEEPGRLRGRVSSQQWPGEKVADSPRRQWSAGVGSTRRGRAGRTDQAVGLRTGG